MKLRRIKGQHGPVVQANSNAKWFSLNRLENLGELAASFSVPNNLAENLLSVLAMGQQGWQQLATEIESLHGSDCDAGAELIPIQPASFRDFMLYEKHVIDSTRGYARRFLPGVYRATSLFEKLTNKDFMAFKPSKLWYRQPIYYFGNHINMGTSGEDVVWPQYSEALDYELELAAILSRPLRNATAEEAHDCIGGFVLLNDFSARDVQRLEMSSGFGPQKSKHFFSTISPVVVTADEFLPRLDALEGAVSINGNTVARCSTAHAQFSLLEAIAHASTDENLVPGEIFGSGTLPGGAGLENGHWLKRGDEITLTLDALKLSNRVTQGDLQ
ncbi:MAG: fumarylacetoacetate hydrolase family protein [Halioglobus sp.]